MKAHVKGHDAEALLCFNSLADMNLLEQTEEDPSHDGRTGTEFKKNPSDRSDPVLRMRGLSDACYTTREGGVMKAMERVLELGILSLAFLILTCSSTAPFRVYERHVETGKKLLRDGEYPQAKTEFVRASEVERRPEALALAATASYKLNDLQASALYITDAERAGNPGSFYFRIAGYKALTLLREGEEQQGLKVLGDYTQAYKQVYDSASMPQVEYMWRKGRVDLPRLEQLVDQQVTEYEDSMDWFSKTHTGPFDKNTSRR